MTTTQEMEVKMEKMKEKYIIRNKYKTEFMKIIKLIYLIIFTLAECKSHNEDNLELMTLYLLNTQRFGRYGHSSELLENESILIMGGQNGYKVQNDLSIYESNKNTVFQIGKMRTNRSNFKSVRLLDGRVFIVGGRITAVNVGENSTVTDFTEIYDPKTNSVIEGPKLNQGRSDFTMDILDDGRVIIAGGKAETVLKSVEIFDSNTMTINLLGNMNFNRYLHTSTKLNNGKILFIGGLDNLQLTIGSTEIFDPNTMSFTQSGNLSVPRVLHTSNLLSNNKIIVTGGYKVNNPPYVSNTKVIEIFDPVTNTFTSVGNITEFRSGHSSNIISSNEMLLCGGEQIVSGIPILSSCEIYNLVSYSVIRSSEMLSKRSFHTTHIISNSKVFIASGYDRVNLDTGIPNANKTSEIYNIDQNSFIPVYGDL